MINHPRRQIENQLGYTIASGLMNLREKVHTSISTYLWGQFVGDWNKDNEFYHLIYDLKQDLRGKKGFAR